MKLSFYARGDVLVTVPGQAHQKGQHLRRVGRERTNDAVPVASKEPFSIDSESDAGQRIKKLVRREPCLWAANKETAAECGVDFVDVEFINNSWVPKAAKPVETTKEGAK